MCWCAVKKLLTHSLTLLWLQVLLFYSQFSYVNEKWTQKHKATHSCSHLMSSINWEISSRQNGRQTLRHTTQQTCTHFTQFKTNMHHNNSVHTTSTNTTVYFMFVQKFSGDLSSLLNYVKCPCNNFIKRHFNQHFVNNNNNNFANRKSRTIFRTGELFQQRHSIDSTLPLCTQ